jgi:two-component sensor histidine kinase/FixJ family two-component response regulator
VDAQNVLIVEDDVRLSEVVGSVLTLAGYRPVIIADHRLIGASVIRWRPRCVILDGEVRSDGESGTWADAAAIHGGHPGLPVVMLSGDSAALAEGRAGRTRRSRAARFVGFVSKPFAVEDFLATMKHALQPVVAAAPARPQPADDADRGNIILFPNLGPAGASDPPEAHLFDTVVHELRQPLTVIRGQLQLGRRHVGTDPARERAAIDAAIAQVDRMSRLLADLLDSVRLASNALSLNVAAFDLVTVIADAIGRHDTGVARRIGFQWPHGTVPVRVDSERVAQILDNLLGNALKYSAPETPIQVTVTVQGAEVEVRVADHGIGVPEDERGRLFAPFFRASSARSVPGNGLGLHISRRLAERQGGRLWLEASSGAGSVFALALPVALDDDGAVSSRDAAPSRIVELSDRTSRPIA